MYINSVFFIVTDIGGSASAPTDDIFGGFASTNSSAQPNTKSGILDLFSSPTTSSLPTMASSTTVPVSWTPAVI